MSLLDRGPVSRPTLFPSPEAAGLRRYPACQSGHEWFEVFSENGQFLRYALCGRCGLRNLPGVGFCESAGETLATKVES